LIGFIPIHPTTKTKGESKVIAPIKFHHKSCLARLHELMFQLHLHKNTNSILKKDKQLACQCIKTGGKTKKVTIS
jgi:hypothetical protein